MPPSDLFPDLLNYDPESADGVRVGESPVPGLTLKRILRGHTDWIGRIAWSLDGHSLASPSKDNTIRIWNVARGECTAVLKEHTSIVYSVAWSPDGQRLASGSEQTICLWNATNGKSLQILEGHTSRVHSVAWSPDGQRLASASHDDTIRLWNATSGKPLQTLEGHNGNVYSVAWSPDGQYLTSAADDDTIRLWNTANGKALRIMEGHFNAVNCAVFSAGGFWLASKSCDDGTIRLWRCDTWACVAVLPESEFEVWPPSCAFHPKLPVLATFCEKDTGIRIWELDEALLLSQATTNSIYYTTAKLVLVGDAGVGKTGLGWRLAHNEFKEHSSTHGQQFWVIDDLCTTRADGTECEAVLWDLAGQHVYRQIHSIFLDNVDAALILFDPTNRQEPLKGAQFWLEQLQGNGKLPPSILVGARMDRGSATIAQEYLTQFCQQYGISGGYISTSAKGGDGLDDLIQRLKAQIPWDEMTTTVTTVTFKRIKDHVLQLKEQPDRQGVLVQPAALRQQLQATDPDWQFTNAEMMTAVGHLETHGYVTILQNSAGDTSILLTPDLLVDLASSIVLLADKHPRELGAISEADLLAGNYSFDELEGLAKAEKQILLDAAVLRFLQHNICFRETFDTDTLLIFPGLIKQKRPLDDDFPATDDVSYVVRGRVENLYAMLVVLLGYTPSFIRINHWQNQAQYEMGKNQICGFRLIEDREGEIELVLYYSEPMPHYGREQFQELFERFLYQREVHVKRFPPVICPEGHLLERATVINRIQGGKDFAFCAECGSRVNLPDLDKSSIGIVASAWLQREEAIARLRSTYEQHLTRIKSYRREWAMPRCYLSHVPEQQSKAETLTQDLKDAGILLIEDATQVQSDDYVVILDTPAYQQAWKQSNSVLTNDRNLIQTRLNNSQRRLISIKLEGSNASATPHTLNGCPTGDFCTIDHYPISLFNLVLDLYAIPLNHAGFAPLRKALHQQWEQTLAGTEAIVSETRKRFDVALSFPGEHREFVSAVADELAAQLNCDRVFYDAYYKAELARINLDTYLQTIYHTQAELVVVFLCAEYEQKEWCGLEWRAIRDLIKREKTVEIMLVRLDDTDISGVFSIDGYIDAKAREPVEIAGLITERLGECLKSRKALELPDFS